MLQLLRILSQRRVGSNMRRTSKGGGCTNMANSTVSSFCVTGSDESPETGGEGVGVDKIMK